MAAPEGNEYWKLRASHGRELEFQSPDELRDAVNGYFDWCHKHPWNKNEVIKSGELAGKIIKVPTERPYTISGLCIHLGISMVTWKTYCNRKDFLNICSVTEEVIKTQKFEGAAVGAFNANIIARDLGLKDTTDVNHGGGTNDNLTVRIVRGNTKSESSAPDAGEGVE